MAKVITFQNNIQRLQQNKKIDFIHGIHLSQLVQIL